MSKKKEETESKITVKYGVPTIYSKAPYRSVCKVVLNYSNDEPERFEYYIQISLDDENPFWEPMGVFLEKTLRPLFESEIFINKCFDILNGDEDPKRLIKLLSKRSGKSTT